MPIKIDMIEYTVRGIEGGWKPVLELCQNGNTLNSGSPESIGTYLAENGIPESQILYIGLNGKLKHRVRGARNGSDA